MSTLDLMLRAEGLRCQLGGREILAGVEINVGEGEVVGLLGPNGAGKTTLMRILSGQLYATAGHIWLQEREVTKLPPHRRALFGLGHLFQTPSAFLGLSVEDNLLGVLELRPGSSRTQRRERAHELLTLFGLHERHAQRAASLSGGECRRLELARLLAAEPRVVLMDEPFAGLDPRGVEDLQREVVSLAKGGVGVLLSDHQVEQTLTICRRACILVAGKIVVSGKPDEVRDHPAAGGAFFGSASNALARSNQWV
ncbi:MAG: ATP-binding cassette domain-containing protein [Deltaproteobacteria bacterium]|nr:ATP-binding cassette domain-containing protein [Deltaproteobacteria bacterium]